jgi:hypothetical protein
MTKKVETEKVVSETFEKMTELVNDKIDGVETEEIDKYESGIEESDPEIDSDEGESIEPDTEIDSDEDIDVKDDDEDNELDLDDEDIDNNSEEDKINILKELIESQNFYSHLQCGSVFVNREVTKENLLKFKSEFKSYGINSLTDKTILSLLETL